MADELKFYDPITREPWHHAKEGAKIPNDALWVIVRGDGIFDTYNHERTVGPDEVIFTREPIAPPSPPLPTEPGYYLDKDGDLWHVNDSGERAILVVGERALENRYYPWGYDDRRYAPFAPVTLVPTDTWDRLRVLDPEDTRDRVDANGVTWTREGGGWLPDAKSAALRCYMSLENIPGPLRFADEVSDR